MGEAVTLTVTGDLDHSTYQSMLWHRPGRETPKPSHLVRLAGQLNWPFTAVTLILSPWAPIL
ncbi:MAG: hypothetical protein IPJ68_06365 [Candidatus Moraniibacteriota bacterium]|nr:MAG: hypothetical protein IPJ68_06365 [Candidatus Moranbacteria bacterium]